jgi:putative ABC transport system substrate-binding protein
MRLFTQAGSIADIPPGRQDSGRPNLVSGRTVNFLPKGVAPACYRFAYRRGEALARKRVGMRRRDFITLFGGAVTTWPLAARAQQPAMPVIGFMSSRSAEDSASVVAAFRQGLAEAGYVEGRNVAIQFRWADGQFDRLPAFAAELVRLPVAVLATVAGNQAPRAAKAATTTIPIVFAIGEDPVKEGLVPSLNRPGANVTGATFFTALLGAKRLGLLRELVPGAEVIALLVNQNSSQGQGQIKDVQDAARGLGQRLVILNGGSGEEIDAAFASLAQQRVGALLVGADPFFDQGEID